MLLIAIVRGAIGLAIIAVAILGIVASFMTEGVGCFGSLILGVFFLIFTILYNTVDEATLEAFMGMDLGDYLPICLVPMVGGLFFPSTHIAGIATSLAVGFTGLMVTGFLNEATLTALSNGVFDVGMVVLLPIVLPTVIIIVAGGLAFRGW